MAKQHYANYWADTNAGNSRVGRRLLTGNAISRVTLIFLGLKPRMVSLISLSTGWRQGRTSYCKGKRDRYAYANPASGDSLNAYDAMCYALAYLDLKNLGWAHPDQYGQRSILTIGSHGRYEGRVPVCSMENVITEMDMRCYLNRYHDLRGSLRDFHAVRGQSLQTVRSIRRTRWQMSTHLSC